MFRDAKLIRDGWVSPAPARKAAAVEASVVWEKP